MVAVVKGKRRVSTKSEQRIPKSGLKSIKILHNEITLEYKDRTNDKRTVSLQRLISEANIKKLNKIMMKEV